MRDWEKVNINELSGAVLGAAIEVHKALSPRLLESAYEHCFAHELDLREIPYERQKMVRVNYKGTFIDAGYRLDFLIAGRLIVELKAVIEMHPIFEAQTITYLKLTGCNLALLINFNVKRLKNGGIKRIAYNL